MSDSSTAFVESVHIENFGCALDTKLELTRLHALIGPNDSGKSTVLAAIRTAFDLAHVGASALLQSSRLDARSVANTVITVTSGAQRVFFGSIDGRWQGRATDPDNAQRVHYMETPLRIPSFPPVRGAKLIRWDPDAIRQPSDLISEDSLFTVGERGEGVAAIYDALLSRDRPAFDRIEADVRRHFPTVKALWLPTYGRSQKGLGLTLNNARVHAKEMSEGMLYWLAFAILSHIDPPGILLIEEPENGLHPSRIAEVIGVLREASKQTQIILATHSPLVINELEPDEVTVITRDANLGTRATRIDQTTHFQQRNKVYALGELWLSFADGDSEAALVPTGASNQSAV